MSDQPEVVQPEVEGQGDGGQTNPAPYQQWLDRIPEAVRGEVEPVFKEWDSNVTHKFQEAAEYRKQWEPYQQIGVHEADPEAVQWALQFYQAAQADPQAIQSWYEAYAQQHGITPAQAAAELQQETPSADFEYVDPGVAALKAQLEQTQQQLQGLASWREQQEQQARIAEANSYIESQMDEMAKKHPGEFNRSYVEKLVAQYVETDPRNAVQRATQDFLALRAEIEKSALQAKVDAPAPAESGGVANTAAAPIRTMAEASRIALEQIRAANQA